jgi:hypothetical protein
MAILRSSLRVVLVIALAGSVLIGTRSAAADEANGAGMRVYRDPATGAFTAPPPGTALPPSARSLGTSAQGLVETPGTSAAGGVTINLGGRFQSAISATADDTGTVRTGCHTDASAGAAK